MGSPDRGKPTHARGAAPPFFFSFAYRPSEARVFFRNRHAERHQVTKRGFPFFFRPHGKKIPCVRGPVPPSGGAPWFPRPFREPLLWKAKAVLPLEESPAPPRPFRNASPPDPPRLAAPGPTNGSKGRGSVPEPQVEADSSAEPPTIGNRPPGKLLVFFAPKSGLARKAGCRGARTGAHRSTGAQLAPPTLPPPGKNAPRKYGQLFRGPMPVSDKYGLGHGSSRPTGAEAEDHARAPTPNFPR